MTHSAPKAISRTHSSAQFLSLSKRHYLNMLNMSFKQNEYNLFKGYFEIVECQQSSKRPGKCKYILPGWFLFFQTSTDRTTDRFCQALCSFLPSWMRGAGSLLHFPCFLYFVWFEYIKECEVEFPSIVSG